MSKHARTVRALPFERSGYVWRVPSWLADEKILEVSYRGPCGDALLAPMRHDELFDMQDAIEDGFSGYIGVPTAFTVCEGHIQFNIRPAYNGSLRIVTEDRR